MFRPVSLLLLVLLCGCSQAEDDLAGMWVGADFPGMVPARIILAPDDTGRVQNAGEGDSQISWRRLDQGRFTLTRADGSTWAGCLAEGAINLRARGERRIMRYYRAQIRHGRTFSRAEARPFQGLACTP